MKIDELNQIIKNIKHNGVYITNSDFSEIKEEKLLYVDNCPTALVYILKHEYYNRAFFYTNSIDDLKRLLDSVDIPFLLFWNCKKLEDDTLKNLGLSLYSTYVRDTVRYDKNPYLEEETNKRRAILQDMYDPDCGEYANEGDAEELLRLSVELFDELSDEIPSLDEWREICRNNECILYRESNEKEGNPIIAFYVWHLEGKKLYSRMSANKYTANILYNLERRVFTEYFDKGIRIFYGWSDYNYSAAKGRRSSSASNLINRLYCHIYSNREIQKKRREVTILAKKEE